MDDDDIPIDQTVRLTRRQLRGTTADAVADAASDDEDAVDERTGLEDRTVVIDRSAAHVVEDHTVVIDRSAGHGDVAVEDRTVVIDRSTAHVVEDHTVVIDRSAEVTVDDRTVAVNRSSEVTVDDRTVAVDRTRRADETAATDVLSDEAFEETVTAPPRRRSDAVAAPAIYKPRPAPLKPSSPPAIFGSIAPTRDTTTPKESVVRRSRRTGLLAVLSVGGASVVSLVGLAVLGLVVFG